MLTQVKINSIDVTSKLINYEVERTWGDAITQCEINVVKGISSLLTLETGQTIEIWRGWTTATDEKIFSGYIESYEPEGGKIKITGKDKLWDLIRKEVNHVYDKTIDASAGKISAIFEDLVETYGGLTASVQDSGTTITLDKFVCNHADPFERCKKLAEALNWQFYYRADTDLVYFEPIGYSTNSLVLTVGTNVMGVPKWTYDNTEMVNDVTIVGAYSEVETTETGRIDTTTGYTTSSVAINFTPISVKLYNDNSNPPTTLKVGGIVGSSSSYDYYIDYNQKKIMPATSFTTASYVEVRYSHAVPIPVNMYNDTSINVYGRFTKTVTFSDIKSVSDAENRGYEYLAKYAQPFIYAELKVKSASTNGFREGQIINVVDAVSTPNVNSNLVITRHRIRYPSDYEELVVGDKTWRLAQWQSDIEEKLKRISEDELQNQDIVINLLSFDNRTNYPIEVENRYAQVYQQSMAGDTLIWGNTNFGIWGTGKWNTTNTFDLIWDSDITNWDDNTWASQQYAFILGNSLLGILGTSRLGGSGTGEVLHFTSQYLNTYSETFIDTDFKDTTSTATWTAPASFTTGQTAISMPIDYNNGVITSATLTSVYSNTSPAGTITDATYVQGTVGNYALNFNGTSAEVVLASAVSLPYNSFSISWWMRRTETDYECIFSKGWMGSSGAIEVDKTANTIRWESYTNNIFQKEAMTTGLNLIDGNWHHFVIVSDASEFCLYSDGTKTYTTTANTDTANQQYSYFGTRQLQTPYTYGEWFKGDLDECRFYNVALTGTEVTTLYSKGQIGRGLVAKYSFEEGTGSTAYNTAPDFSFYLTANGSDWEQVYLTESHTFSNTGTDLRWKAVSGGTATLTSVSLTGYH